jgi:hypothetical protein
MQETCKRCRGRRPRQRLPKKQIFGHFNYQKHDNFHLFNPNSALFYAIFP